MSRFTFPKSEKLKLRNDINVLMRSKKSFIKYPVRVVWNVVLRPEDDSPIKVMTMAPKRKLKTAVDRNRVKRLMREAYRLNKQEIFSQFNASDKQLHIGFVYLSSDIVSFERLSKSIILSLQNLSEKIDATSILDKNEENFKQV